MPIHNMTIKKNFQLQIYGHFQFPTTPNNGDLKKGDLDAT